MNDIEVSWIYVHDIFSHDYQESTGLRFLTYAWCTVAEAGKTTVATSSSSKFVTKLVA